MAWHLSNKSYKITPGLQHSAANWTPHAKFCQL